MITPKEVIAIYRYNGKPYMVTDMCNETEDPYDLWVTGGYTCDCNRADFIRRQCDPAFPEFECGDTIELIAFLVDGKVVDLY